MTCDRCDGHIRAGDVYYLVEVGITADMDPTPLGMLSSSELSLGLQRALEVASSLPEEELNAGVFERRAFLICGPCRKAYRKNPLGRPTQGGAGLVH